MSTYCSVYCQLSLKYVEVSKNVPVKFKWCAQWASFRPTSHPQKLRYIYRLQRIDNSTNYRTRKQYEIQGLIHAMATQILKKCHTVNENVVYWSLALLRLSNHGRFDWFQMKNIWNISKSHCFSWPAVPSVGCPSCDAVTLFVSWFGGLCFVNASLLYRTQTTRDTRLTACKIFIDCFTMNETRRFHMLQKLHQRSVFFVL